jgi:NADH dehydrogenase
MNTPKYAALSSARLRDIKAVSPEALEIALVAPEPTLVVRPAALRTQA